MKEDYESEENTENTEKMVKDHIKPIINKLTETLIMVALLKLKTATNKELSEYLGFRPQQTSMYLKKLEQYEYINRSSNILENYDQRSVKIRLTVLGHSQAWLARMSMHLVPGEDKLAAGVVKAIKVLMGKK